MNRKLKIKKFTPCPVDDGDEFYPNGIFVFNITKMMEFIRKRGIQCEDVMIKDFSKPTTKFEEVYLSMVDVTKPIIVAEISPGRYNVIDGNHRMEQARRMGMEKLPAYKISPDQHLQFLTTEQSYMAYVEYWNSKLKELHKRKTS